MQIIFSIAEMRTSKAGNPTERECRRLKAHLGGIV